MPRRPRENVENGIYHAFARGNNRMPLYSDAGDRKAFLRMLEVVVRRWNWRCLSYCLMTNHIHLVLETPEANLSQGMQVLQARYARAEAHRHTKRRQ